MVVQNDRNRMHFLREAYTELKAAFGNRWSVLSLIVAAIVAKIDWFLRQLAGFGMSPITGIPDWVLGILVFAVLAVIQALVHAVKLRRMVTPSFSLSTDKGGAIVIAVDRQYDAGGHFVKEFTSRYVRIRADALSKINIRDGVAFITELKKRPLQRTDEEIIHLPQPILLEDERRPFTIYHAVPKMIDFIKCDEEHNRLFVIGRWPIVMENAFEDRAFYTFTIMVNAGGVSASRKVEVMWNGKYDEMTARDVTTGG